MRGEHVTIAVTELLLWGSSPHARGALWWVGDYSDVNGIIPACAGSTGRLRAAAEAERDHPRMRGEHAPRRTGRTAWRGSSPHARGALAPVHLTHICDGIIPACAGSTSGA